MSALVILWSQVQVLVGHQETLKPSSADFVISDRLLWVGLRHLRRSWMNDSSQTHNGLMLLFRSINWNGVKHRVGRRSALQLKVAQWISC